MKLLVDEIKYTNAEDTRCYGFKYIVRNEDNTKFSSSKNGLYVAVRNFMKKYKLNDVPTLYSNKRTQEIIEV